ncbi:MAG: lyase [Rhodoglobus sp.]|nr:lyase [Rhodoglobus sp.]
MTISLRFTNVTVNDVDEAIGFYRDALGLEVQNDVASGDYRWVTLGTDTQPGLGIVISEPHAGRSQADGDAMQQLLTKGSLPLLVFSSDDVDAAFEKIRATGAEVLQEPMDQPWGPRDCAFRDPSGNTVRISQAHGRVDSGLSSPSLRWRVPRTSRSGRDAAGGGCAAGRG